MEADFGKARQAYDRGYYGIAYRLFSELTEQEIRTANSARAAVTSSTGA